MKRYSLLLFILSLATLQASAQPDLLNSNIPNEKPANSSTYIRTDLTKWQAWIKDIQYKDLQRPLMDLYRDAVARPTAHIKKTPPVYFVVGPTRAGKSTFIFALQGNKVARKKPDIINSDDSDSFNASEEHSTDTHTDNLILTKTIHKQLATPGRATSIYITTKDFKIYYTGQKIKQPMAFCSTASFLRQSNYTISKAEKVVCAYAPHFILQTNTIGGIVLLVPSEDIMSAKYNRFFTFMRLIEHYFGAAMKHEERNNLKKSLILLINKQEGFESSTFAALGNIIKDAYEDYYKGELSNKNSYNNNRIGYLKPFFSLFLKKDIPKDKVNKAKFHKLLDTNKVHFFYPHQSESVDKVRTKLRELTPLALKYLSGQDNHLSQYLTKQVMARAYAMNQETYQALKYKNLAQLQSLILQKNNNLPLKILNSKLQQYKKQLTEKNKKISYNKSLQCVYDDRHIQRFFQQQKKQRSAFVVLGLAGLGLGGLAGLGSGNIIGHEIYKNKCYKPSDKIATIMNILHALAGGAIGSLIGGAIGGVVGGTVGGVFDTIGRLASYYNNKLYFGEDFTYTGNELIDKIVIKDENKGSITWHKPGSSFIADHFNKQTQRAIITLTSKQQSGVKHNTWHILHHSAYAHNTRCHVQFFSKKNHLKATQWQLKDNKKTMNRIDNLLSKLEIFKKTNKNKLEKNYASNKSTANDKMEEIIKQQEEMNMINCWTNYIFRKDSAKKELITQYNRNYNETLIDIDYLFIDNTNKKNGNNKIELQLKNTMGEDYEYNNNNNSSSNLKASVPLTITAILARLLSQQN